MIVSILPYIEHFDYSSNLSLNHRMICEEENNMWSCFLCFSLSENTGKLTRRLKFDRAICNVYLYSGTLGINEGTFEGQKVIYFAEV